MRTKSRRIQTLLHLLFITAIVLVSLTLPPTASAASGTWDHSGTLWHDGKLREYSVYIPASYTGSTDVPLVMMFHGGTFKTEPEDFAAYTKFNDIADDEGCIVVYPKGINKHWNDGRGLPDASEDDVGFVNALLNVIEGQYTIDEDRIYAAGMSNGAIFCQLLAIELPHRLQAVASVCGQMAVNVLDGYTGSPPISVLLMNGTEDSIVPYDGGTVWPNRGEVIDTWSNLYVWGLVNSVTTGPYEQTINRARWDGCTVERTEYAGGINGTKVVLYKVNGGGHSWPWRWRYELGACRDIDAHIEIWDFFCNS